jgi:hypothetical protein
VLDSPGHAVSNAIRQFAEKHVISTNAVLAAIPDQLRDDRRGGGLLRRKAARHG